MTQQSNRTDIEYLTQVGVCDNCGAKYEPTTGEWQNLSNHPFLSHMDGITNEMHNCRFPRYREGREQTTGFLVLRHTN